MDRSIAKKYPDLGYLLIALGATGILVAAFADSIGISRSGFGPRQSLALIRWLPFCALAVF